MANIDPGKLGGISASSSIKHPAKVGPCARKRTRQPSRFADDEATSPIVVEACLCTCLMTRGFHSNKRRSVDRIKGAWLEYFS